MKQIESPLEAYFFGWMITDGCISNYKKAYSWCTKLKIHKDDEDVLNLFLNLSSFTKKQEKNTNCIAITSYNKEFALNLVSLGCLPRKSKEENEMNIHFPKLKEELYPYYIRGLFDGDGSYYFRNKINLNCSLYGRNLNLFKELSDFLNEKLNIAPEIRFVKNKYRGIWVFRIRKNKDVKIFIDYVFSDTSDLTLSCKRKMDKIIQFKKNYKTVFEIRSEAMKGIGKGKKWTDSQREKVKLLPKKVYIAEDCEKIRQGYIKNSKYDYIVLDAKGNILGKYPLISLIEKASLDSNIFNIDVKNITNPNGRNGYPFYFLSSKNISYAILKNIPYKGLFFHRSPSKIG